MRRSPDRMRLMRQLGATVLLLACLPSAAAASGSVPINPFHRPGDLHLDFPMISSPPSSFGFPPAAIAHAVGDVNGDGRADVGMSISDASTGTATTWVAFLPGPGFSTTAVDDPGWAGLRITGAASATGLAGVGDLNGDGRGDVAISSTDAVYVIYGSPVPGTVDVGDLGTRGFTVTGVRPCPASGGGNLYTGVFWRGSSVARIDGGLAICGWDTIFAVRPPAGSAGRTFDVRQPDAAISRIDLGGGRYGPPTFGTLADGSLLIAWIRDGIGHILRAPAPPGGAAMTLADVEASAAAAELEVPAGSFEQVTPMSDINGDGRGDAAVSLVDATERRRFVAHLPAAGTHTTVAAAGSTPADERFSGITDAGDQDGDGRPDLAYDAVVELSGDGTRVSIDQSLPACVPLRQAGSGSLVLCSLSYNIADTLPDDNGDGKPELIAIHADPLPIEDGVTHTTWRLDVFPSAATPVAEGLEVPVETSAGDLDFAGTFTTGAVGLTRSLGALATVAVTLPDGTTRTASGSMVDAGAATTVRATVHATPGQLGLMPGRTYSFRLTLENGRGLSASLPVASFAYQGRPGAPGTPPAPAAPKPKSPAAPAAASARGRTLIGTRRADRLRGTAEKDVLKGKGGNDALWGGAGNDVLDGGTGRDVLHGGSGSDRLLAADGARDLVDCGAGRDTAVVDRRDRVRHCERIRRRAR